MHSRFGLTLIVNHACNLRCTYCYTGEKFRRPMPREVGVRAIMRAIRSLDPGGALDLAFFGGEPLIEAELILEMVDYAREAAAQAGVELALSMTTNGTFDSASAWSVMTLSEMRLAISHDGLPSVHDAFRTTTEEQPSSQRVLSTIDRLLEAGKEFRTVMVVQPNTVRYFPAGIKFLYERGVRQFDPSLNLWTLWTRADGERLREAIADAADFWIEHLPECSISWFDEKIARLTDVSITETARCGFGVGEIAVTPAGNLYPCERLVGADAPTNAMRLPGSVFEGADFLGAENAVMQSPDECSPCSIKLQCGTKKCRCSNFVRTGDVNRPDGLLCLLDQSCHREVMRVWQSRRLQLV